MLIDFVQGVRSNYHIALYFWRMYDIYNRLKNDQKLPKSQLQIPRGFETLGANLPHPNPLESGKRHG